VRLVSTTNEICSVVRHLAFAEPRSFGLWATSYFTSRATFDRFCSIFRCTNRATEVSFNMLSFKVSLCFVCVVLVPIFCSAQYSQLTHALFAHHDLYTSASSSWPNSWHAAWDPWTVSDYGWSNQNEVSYASRYQPKIPVFEAAEVLLIGRKKNETIRGVVQIYQFVR
jgi:hypothetical protein